MYQHVKHSGWGIHWNALNTGRLILQYFITVWFASGCISRNSTSVSEFKFYLKWIDSWHHKWASIWETYSSTGIELWATYSCSLMITWSGHVSPLYCSTNTIKSCKSISKHTSLVILFATSLVIWFAAVYVEVYCVEELYFTPVYM